QKEMSYVAAGGDSVEFRLVETNDWYRLLERPPSATRLVYWFDAQDRIAGTLVQGVPAPPTVPPRPGRMAEFKAWEAARDSSTLAWLLPGGRLMPDLAHARRWKAELTAWPRAAGLPAGR